MLTDQQQAALYAARRRRKTWNVYLSATGEFQSTGHSYTTSSTLASTPKPLPTYNAATHKPFFTNGAWVLHSI